MAEIAGPNPAGPTSIFDSEAMKVSDDEHHEEDDFPNNFSKNSSDEEPEDSLAYVNRKLKAGRLGVGETLVLQQKMAIRRAGLRKKESTGFRSAAGATNRKVARRPQQAFL